MAFVERVPGSRSLRRRTIAAGLVLSTFAVMCSEATSGSGETSDSPDAGGDSGSAPEETFRNPPVLEPSADGVYELALDATEVTLDGQRHCVRAYNGAYVAPTIEVPQRSGDEARSIRVNLANRLSRSDVRSLEGTECECQDSMGMACNPTHHDACATTHGECTCLDADGEACEHMFDFNVTNLHAHGSHVRPDYARGGADCEPTTESGLTYACRECGDDVCDGTGDDACFHGDNVLNAVLPGTGAQYRWDLDEDGTHHTGLQWYHPHIHGTTAIQVASGAAGTWIVRGPLDELAGVADARERILIFSTPSVGENGFVPLADGETCSVDTLTFNDFATLGDTTAPQVNVINGMRRPRMVTPPGQVERWRLLHAGYLDEVFLGLFRGSDPDCTAFSTAEADTIELTQIGRDGLILPQKFEHENVFMSPGYRVEAMLGGEGNLRDGETWCLVAARFLQESDTETFGGFGQEPFSPTTPPSATDLHARFESEGDVVAILNVTSAAGEATTTTLPDYEAIAALAPDLNLGGVDIDERCAGLAAVTEPDAIDQVAVLQVGYFTTDDPDPCDCEGYNVNCANFESTDRSRYPVDRELPLDAIEHWRVAASFDGHPFHIHINPYVVCPNDNIFDPIPFPHWRDTYLVNLKRKIDLVTQNRAFTGPYVFHCHKLTHEDHGMMELVRVCDPATDTTCGDQGWNACEADDLQCWQFLASTKCSLVAETDPEAAACVAELGGPTGVCGPNACVLDADCVTGVCGDDHVCVANACVADGDCPLTHACDVSICAPTPCPAPCPPGSTCQHGVCG